MALSPKEAKMRYKSIPKLTIEQQERFWSLVDVYQPAGCWEWMGTRRADGYGVIKFGKNNQFRAHRVAYELLLGSIPADLPLDHLCRNRACVNPDHLESVNQRENLRRGYGFPGILSRLTHCMRGHEFTPENTLIDRNGCRQCLICHRGRKRLQMRRKRVA